MTRRRVLEESAFSRFDGVRLRMANVSSTPRFSGMKYRVVKPLGCRCGQHDLRDQRQDGRRQAICPEGGRSGNMRTRTRTSTSTRHERVQGRPEAQAPGDRARSTTCRPASLVVQGGRSRALDGVRRRQDAGRDRGPRDGAARAHVLPGRPRRLPTCTAAGSSTAT